MPVAVTLDDKYVLESGRVYLTGTQALVRLPMMQRQRDLAAGLNTAGYHLGLSRLAAGRLRPGAVAGQEASSRTATSSSSPASTRTSPPPRSGAPSRSISIPARKLRRRVRHVVRQGPGRRPLRATCSSTPTMPARPGTAACWRWRATTTWPSRRPPPHQSEPALIAAAHPDHPCRQRAGISSTSACTASPCRATPACWVAFKVV